MAVSESMIAAGANALREARVAELETALAAAHEALKLVDDDVRHHVRSDVIPSGAMIRREAMEAARAARKLTEAVGPPCPSPPAA